jgi:hypothetical protein
MPKMTKAQARRRLKEAENKFKKVYMADFGVSQSPAIVGWRDMDAIQKIVDKCIKRIR